MELTWENNSGALRVKEGLEMAGHINVAEVEVMIMAKTAMRKGCLGQAEDILNRYVKTHGPISESVNQQITRIQLAIAKSK